jgi:D-sedoheptulose 7-phosphate isomerase
MSALKKYHIPHIERSAAVIINTIKKNHRIYFIGNGGSAADCQHLAAEFVGMHHSSVPLPAIALTTDTSVLTSISNDHSFEHIFDMQIRAIIQPDDTVIAISTSGMSNNILSGIELAKALGANTIALTGNNGGRLAALCDISIIVPSHHAGHIQEAHIMIGHMIYELVCKVLNDDK